MLHQRGQGRGDHYRFRPVHRHCRRLHPRSPGREDHRRCLCGNDRPLAESGKQIPLHWNHSSAAEDIIGTVDPASMREEPNVGLHVRGQLDLEDSEVATHAWRLMKNNSVGLSFGYLVLEDSKGEDGVRELKALDLFEITVTPAPANADARILSTKAADCPPEWVGTWLDPVLPDGSSAVVPSMSIEEARAQFEELTRGIDTRPAPKIVSFEC